MTPPRIVTKNRVGRPRVPVTVQQVQRLRSDGSSWRQVARHLGIGTATAMRLVRSIGADHLDTDEVRPNTREA